MLVRWTAEVAPHGRRPPIRLRPVPAFDPPFDDELAPEVWASAHQLTFDWGKPEADDATHRPSGNESTTADPAGSTPAGSTQAGSDPAGSTPAGSDPADGESAVAGASAEARMAVRRFVSVCVEVLNGYRPAAHLRRLSAPADAAGIVDQAVAANRRVAELRLARGRTARGANRHSRRPDPVVVHGLRLCEPRAGAVEAAVLLITGERTWAVAIRMERHQHSWAATILRLV